jgi:hypothetical protein
MPEIPELSGKVQEVVRAAIAAEMYDPGYAGDCDKGFVGHARADESFPEGREIRVTYPDARVETLAGNPAPESEPSVDAASVYAKWHDEIPQNFERFNDVPEPSAFDADIQTLAEVANSLDVRGATITGEGAGSRIHVGNMDLRGMIIDILGELDDYHGEAFDTLHDQYLWRLEEVIGGQRLLVAILGVLVVGEKQTWAAAREDLLTIADNARKAFDTHAGIGVPPDPKMFLRVVSSITSAVAQIPGLKGFQGLNWLVGQFEKWVPEPPKPEAPKFNGRTTNEIHGQLVFALSELGSTYVFGQEQRLQDAARSASAAIVEHPSAYDLRTSEDFLGRRRGDYFADESVFLRTKNLREVAGTVSRVGGILEEIRNGLAGSLGREHWRRDSGLGIDRYGHYAAYEQLHADTSNVVSRTSRALDELAERMVQVSYDFERTDEQVNAELRRLRKEVDDPSPDDSYGRYGY